MKVFVATILLLLAVPLRAQTWVETWVVLAKPSMEVIGTFELDKGGMVNVDVDTRKRYGGICLKLIEIINAVPVDLVRLADIEASQATIEGESVPMVTVSIEKAVIAAGFAKQKYTYDFQKEKFELRQVEPLIIGK